MSWDRQAMKERIIHPPESTPHPEPNASSDVHTLSVDGRTVILIGTAHVSQESVELVQGVMTSERPDRVCVELDERRYTALSQQQQWGDLDLKTILRQRQLGPVLVGLILSAYQKRLGGRLGVVPGTEMLEAIHLARQQGIPITLCDRDVRVTLGRAWRTTPWHKKFMLAASLLASLFDTSTVSEDTLRELRQHDALTMLLHELGEMLPSLRQVLIDERDIFMAEMIRRTPGERLVAVVGAAHVPGIRRALAAGKSADLHPLTTVPPVSPLWRWLPWAIPAAILSALLLIGWQQGVHAAGHNALFWVLANGIPSALGAAVALAHPVTILTAFVAAPLTSLTPVIGAGYVTALVQAYLRPPTVRELQTVADDVQMPRRWWQNRLLRIFLAFLLPGLGSMLGTWIGGYEILSNLF